MPLLDEAFFLVPALNPGGGSSSPIAPETMLRSELTQKRLEEYRVLFLLNLPQIAAAEERALGEYLEGGGSVVVFPGDAVKPDAWNRLAEAGASALGALVPARLGEVLRGGAAEEPVTLDDVDFEHPVLGRTKVLGNPVKLSQTPGRVKSAAPELGEHTEEILLDRGGYTRQEIASLKQQGIIR